MSADKGRKTMDVEEAAALLGISINAAYAAARRGELPVIRLGRRVLIVRERLEAMLSMPDVGDDERAQLVELEL